jgi:hypothetical protein
MLDFGDPNIFKVLLLQIDEFSRAACAFDLRS